MEIQPPLTLASTNSRNTFFPENKLNIYRRQNNIAEPNRLEVANQRRPALTENSTLTSYNEKELIKSAALINRPPQYPFQSRNDLFPDNYQMPYFLDRFNYNVNTLHTLGRPLGSDNIDAPEVVLIDNLMKLKEYQTQGAILRTEAAKKIYEFETEQGANYYLNQIEAQRAALEKRARNIRATQKEIPTLTFRAQIPIGKIDLKGENKIRNTTYYTPNVTTQRTMRQQRIDNVQSLINEGSVIPPEEGVEEEGVEEINEEINEENTIQSNKTNKTNITNKTTDSINDKSISSNLTNPTISTSLSSIQFTPSSLNTTTSEEKPSDFLHQKTTNRLSDSISATSLTDEFIQARTKQQADPKPPSKQPLKKIRGNIDNMVKQIDTGILAKIEQNVAEGTANLTGEERLDKRQRITEQIIEEYKSSIPSGQSQISISSPNPNTRTPLKTHYNKATSPFVTNQTSNLVFDNGLS